MASKILTEFKQRLEAMELEPASGGCFELSIDDQLVYSKLDTGEFPSDEVMVEEVRQRL